MKNIKTGFIFKFTLLIFLAGLFQQQAFATASFARATGASCNKCHTATFPRLTAKGERFMLNGFQILKKADEGFSLDDDEDTKKENKFKLPKVSEILSVTGQFNAFEVSSNNTTPTIGNPKVVTVVAAGSLMKDMPIWAGVDVGDSDNDGTDEATVHRYQIGFTNIADTKLINIRMGTLAPTTWTSFYGHSAALESASSGIGSYGEGHSESTGFATVGSGYAERNAMEYYGYTATLLWSIGLSNASGHHGGNPNDPLDYWVTTRYEFMKNSTVSFLWYNANGDTENQTYTAAANLRLGKLDFLGQFSIDNTGSKVTTETGTKTLRDKWGFTTQVNYAATKKSMGIIRFDVTDNGEKTTSVESQLTVAMVLKPEQNIKVTASYVMEVDSVGSGAGGHDNSDGHHGKPGARAIRSRATDPVADPAAETASAFGDHFKVNIRYMF